MQTAIIIVAYLTLSLLMGEWNRRKGLGFWLGFLFSLFLTPVIGALVIASERAARVVRTATGLKKICPHCSQLTPLNSPICRSCGKNIQRQALKDYLRLAELFIGLVATVFLVRALMPVTGSRHHMKQSSSRTADVSKTDLEVLSYDWDDDDDTILKGTIQNNTDKQLNYVAAKFIIYDSEGNPIDTVSATGNQLSPQGKLDFHLSVLNAKADSVHLMEVVGW